MKKLSLATMLAGVVLMATPVSAQSDRDQQDRGQRQQQAQQQRSRQRDQQSTNYRLQPRGWVTIGVDSDDDKQFDRYETIYYYDLQQAKQRSQQRRADQGRANQGQRQQRDDRQMDRRQQDRRRTQQDGRRRQQAQQQQRVRLQGEVVRRSKLDLVGDQDKDVAIAQLRTQDGRRVSAYLGALDRVRKLDIQQGDQITVEGVRSAINNQPFIIARRVSKDGQSITNPMPRRQDLRRCDGEIVNLRTATFKGRDGEFVVAKIRGSKDDKKTINLGRKDELKNLNLEEGDRITALVRDGRIGGEDAIIAQMVRANGKTADVRGSTNARLSDRGGQSRR